MITIPIIVRAVLFPEPAGLCRADARLLCLPEELPTAAWRRDEDEASLLTRGCLLLETFGFRREAAFS
jgi:hypothetical protein